MSNRIFLGCLLVLVTTAIHVVATAVALDVLRRVGHMMHWDKTSRMQQPFMVGALVVALFLVSVLDAVMWAYVYPRVGAIEQLETAIYFSAAHRGHAPQVVASGAERGVGDHRESEQAHRPYRSADRGRAFEAGIWCIQRLHRVRARCVRLGRRRCRSLRGRSPAA